MFVGPSSTGVLEPLGESYFQHKGRINVHLTTSDKDTMSDVTGRTVDSTVQYRSTLIFLRSQCVCTYLIKDSDLFKRRDPQTKRKTQSLVLSFYQVT